MRGFRQRRGKYSPPFDDGLLRFLEGEARLMPFIVWNLELLLQSQYSLLQRGFVY